MSADKASRGYTQQDWDEVSDHPEADKDQISKAIPIEKALPGLAANLKKSLGGRPKKDNPKKPVSIRLDPDIIAKFKATGPGWQTRINEALKSAAADL